MIGTQLRDIRKQAGWTQAGLAERLGTTLNTVARWERDEVAISEPVAKLVGYVAREAGVEPAHRHTGRGAVADKTAQRRKTRAADRAHRRRPRG